MTFQVFHDLYEPWFITPWGRYHYKTAPQGYIASGNSYSRRFDEIVPHVPNKTKCIDDTLLWADDLNKSFFQAVDWLDLCGHNVSRHPTGTTKPDLLVLPDDIAATAALAALGRSLLTGIRQNEPQPRICSITIVDQQTSSASSTLNTMAVIWERVKLATTSNRDMTQLINISESGFPKFCH